MILNPKDYLHNRWNTIGLIPIDKAKEFYGVKWDKLVSIKRWMPVNEGNTLFERGIFIQNKKKKNQERFVTPILDKILEETPASWCYNLDYIHDVVKIFKILEQDDDLECMVYPDRAMPMIIYQKNNPALVVMISPRIYE